MVDCKYPHRVTLALTQEALDQFQQEMNFRHMMGDLSRCMTDSILLHILAKMENPTNSFPVFLEMVKRRTIVPCKECHEHPCTCDHNESNLK